MNNKLNKIQLLKSFISVIAIFLFNLPTLAALNIDYKNLFVIPGSSTLLAQADTAPPSPPSSPPPPAPTSPPSPINHNQLLFNYLNCNNSVTSNQNVSFSTSSIILTNVSPSSITTGDLNNDSNSDLAVVDSNLNAFVTLDGSPSASFSNIQTNPLTFSPSLVSISNLNPAIPQTISLLPEVKRQEIIIKTLDKVNNKYGDFTLQRGILLTSTKIKRKPNPFLTDRRFKL